MSVTLATTAEGAPRRPETPAPGARPVLIVAWAAAEPARIGEVLPVPSGAAALLGRGGDPLVRQRPGRNEPTGPLRSPRISRRQLRIEALRDGRLHVENIGRRALQVRGAPTREAVVAPGDVLRLEDELLLLCALRPPTLPPCRVEATFPWGRPDPDGVVGESPAIWAFRDRVAFVGPRPGHVLVIGSTGAGKELAARALHRRSPRADGPFVSRGAATIPAALADAELFGAAPSVGGGSARRGLIGRAEGGTLFLDEIGDLSAGLRARLLRLMDGGEYQRPGEDRTRVADVRIVAATNRPAASLAPDLRARFRHVVAVPPLDDRREDIPLLALHLLRRAVAEDPELRARFADEAGEPRISADLVASLLADPLALQVRGLDEQLWRGLGASRGDHVEPASEPVPPAAEPPPPPGDSGDAAAVLTARELEVLELLGRGATYQLVADALGIALGTVQAHVKAIYRKLEVCTKAEAVSEAIRRGLLDPTRRPP